MTRALVLAVLIAGPAVAAERGTVIEGAATVIDGDTVDVGRVRVRLNGAAAPETHERGGTEATEALRRIISGQRVRCVLNGELTRGREVGICHAGRVDIGGAVVAAGRARDCRRYSNGRYAAVERPEAQTLPLPDYCLPRR